MGDQIMKAPVLLITNADDFGLSHAVNTEVERLHVLGVLSSATVMANGAAVEEVPDIQRRNPGLGLGVHLNATNFKAFTPRMRSSRLCDDAGNFNSGFRDHHHVGLTRMLVEEWTAQIEFLQSLGLVIDHIDSHHHVHTWPSALPALLQVCKQTGIHWVRNTRNLVPDAERAGMRGRMKYSGKSLWTKACRLAGLDLTKGFCSVHDFRQLSPVLGSLTASPSTLELMCHPGDFGHVEYVEECSWMENELPQLLGDGFQLMSYSALAQRRER
jgi:predicted glycoside hydrolase/deacetylase ChbG (UPF0249 family)